jgi:hypothetical protein
MPPLNLLNFTRTACLTDFTIGIISIAPSESEERIVSLAMIATSVECPESERSSVFPGERAFGIRARSPESVYQPHGCRNRGKAMKILLPSVGALALLGAVTPAPALAQAPKAAHTLVIYNGADRTVAHYDNKGALLREPTRAENEAKLADQVLALKLQYVKSERALEPRRRNMQSLLYGYSTTFPSGLYPSMAFSPYNAGPQYWGLSWGWGAPYGGFYGGLGTSTYSLANGVGDQGDILRALAPTLAAPPPKPN